MGRGEPRFEVVRTDGEQPWHARLCTNGRIAWHTENYTRRIGAERAIYSLVAALGGTMLSDEGEWNVEGVEKYLGPRLPMVKYVDERESKDG